MSLQIQKLYFSYPTSHVTLFEDFSLQFYNDWTCVAGSNGCGKSTLLRTFPLLKQSITKSLSSPILWYGDYVDFGSFKKALTRDADTDNIILTFVFDELHPRFRYSFKNKPSEIRVSLTLDDKRINEYLIEIKEL